jgi:hypothetical protein
MKTELDYLNEILSLIDKRITNIVVVENLLETLKVQIAQQKIVSMAADSLKDRKKDLAEIQFLVNKARDFYMDRSSNSLD